MKKIKIKINKIEINDNMLYIYSYDSKIFTSEIIKGSITFKIYNEDNNEISLSNLEIDNRIIIFTKNNLVINKIIIKNIYVLNSEESESDFEEIN